MTIKHTWELYKKATSLNVANWMTYRSSFALFLLGVVVFNIFGPLLAYIIYSNNLSFPGWTLYQVYVLMGSLTLLTGVGWYFMGAITWVSQGLIRKGKFDAMMIHPFAPLKLLILRNPDVGSISEILFGAFIVVFGFIKMDIMMTPTKLGLYILMLFSGIMFIFSTSIMTAALNFYFVKVNAIQSLFENMMGFARYPISIYGTKGFFILTFLFPVSLISFYPATTLIGSSGTVTVLRSLILGGAYLVGSLVLWRQAIKHYTSAGG